MMPALALEMARRNHDLVLGRCQGRVGRRTDRAGCEGGGCAGYGGPNQGRHDSETGRPCPQDAFGGFDSACIRTGTHGTGTILEATAEDCQIQYEGNFRSVFYALQALLPPLVEQRSGQVVINTSAGGSATSALRCAVLRNARGGQRAHSGRRTDRRAIWRNGQRNRNPCDELPRLPARRRRRYRPDKRARTSRKRCRCGNSASPRRRRVFRCDTH